MALSRKFDSPHQGSERTLEGTSPGEESCMRPKPEEVQSEGQWMAE
jgi:hypothetical protein